MKSNACLLIYFTYLWVLCSGISSDYMKKFSVFDNFADKHIAKTANVNDELCDRQLQTFSEAFNEREDWALRLFDLWAKMQSGIFEQNLINIGHFVECVRFRHDTQRTDTGIIQGQHCFVTTVGFQTNDTDDRSPWQDIGSILGTITPIVTGYCMPASCSPEKVVEFTNMFLFRANLEGIAAECRTNDPQPFTALDIFAIVLFSIVALIMIASTIYDVILRRYDMEPNKLLISFSVNTNGRELFDITESKSPKAIKCLLGLRALSLFWIIFGHRFEFLPFFPAANRVTFNAHYEHFYASIHTAFNIAVDTFLIMGSLLATTSMLSALDKKNLNIPRLILHRYLRYTPVLAALVLYSASLYKFLMTGPNSDDLEIVNCQKFWWSTLLHIQNYVNPDKLCVGHSWYLSVDFQLFILTPFLIYPAWRWGWKYLWSLLVLGFASSTMGFLVHFLLDAEYWFSQGYLATHVRAAPWMLGMVLAYILHSYRDKKITISRKLNAFGWILSLSTLATITILHLYVTRRERSRLVFSLFLGYHRTIWALAICWIIFACHKLKTGGIVNWFLSLRQWQPIGRMSLSMYLVHLVYQLLHLRYQKDAPTLEIWPLIHLYWGDLVASIILGTTLYLSFETPFPQIEAYIYKIFGK